MDKESDFGTGNKKLGIYTIGFISCVVLTLIAFATVMLTSLSRTAALVLIFLAAIFQFFIQVICFLRLNVQTEQGVLNVMTFVFTGIILTSVLAGSLWIMWNCNYYMSH